ncbi:GDSL-type esterase/lipase family protein [Microbacterium sp. NPDC076911]|uniref:GDSL-type esterase/lipase family protein n=1 Tax=Microbacterium sp. NPDC076911 TaxID=3154958 RepID=UPI00343DAC7F
MARVADQSAGIFLDFLTAASVLELDALLVRTLPLEAADSARPAVFEVTVDGEPTDRVVSTGGTRVRARSADDIDRSSHDPFISIRFTLGPATGAERRVQLWLPHTANVTILALRSDGTVTAARPETATKWIHYGSSISHSADADGPLGTWPTVAARQLGWQLTNMGFGGQAMLDQFVARTIRDLPADVITLKVGINPLNADALRVRTFGPAVHGFLDTIRDGHPETRIVLISPIACPAHEHIPGPTVLSAGAQFVGTPDRGDRPGVLTLELERDILQRLVAQRNDASLLFLDGRSLFAEADAAHLYDGLHPDAAGYKLIGDRFAELFSSF